MRSFLRLLKLHKLAVGKLSRGGLTWCHGVLDHGLNLHLVMVSTDGSMCVRAGFDVVLAR